MYLMRMMRRRICRGRMSCSRRRRRGRRVPGRRRPGHGIQSQDWSVIRRRSIIRGMVCKITSDSCSSCRMKIMMMMWMFTHSVKEDVDVIRRDDGGCRTRWSWSVHNNDQGEGLWWDIFYSSKQRSRQRNSCSKILLQVFIRTDFQLKLNDSSVSSSVTRQSSERNCNTFSWFLLPATRPSFNDWVLRYKREGPGTFLASSSNVNVSYSSMNSNLLLLLQSEPESMAQAFRESCKLSLRVLLLVLPGLLQQSLGGISVLERRGQLFLPLINFSPSLS